MFIYIYPIQRRAREKKEKLKGKENFSHEKVFMTQLLTILFRWALRKRCKKRRKFHRLRMKNKKMYKNNCLSLFPRLNSSAVVDIFRGSNLYGELGLREILRERFLWNSMVII